MLRVDWSWLPFSRPARSKGGGGRHITFRRYCCSKWWKGRTPRSCSNHVFVIHAADYGANHSRSGCDHTRIGDSTVLLKKQRRASRQSSQTCVKRPARSTPCRSKCAGEEASAAITTTTASSCTTGFRLKMSSQLSSSAGPVSMDHGGLSVTGPRDFRAFTSRLFALRNPCAQKSLTRREQQQLAWADHQAGGVRGREYVPERQR